MRTLDKEGVSRADVHARMSIETCKRAWPHCSRRSTEEAVPKKGCVLPLLSVKSPENTAQQF